VLDCPADGGLAALVGPSTVVLPREEHQAGHSEANNFMRWGRRGGLVTLRRYGTLLILAAGEETLGSRKRD
jgi:hypothetical protein